jgi:hypothetical protein
MTIDPITDLIDRYFGGDELTTDELATLLKWAQTDDGTDVSDKVWVLKALIKA